MPRLAKFVKVTFDSFWMSGELTLKERKANSFARTLNKNHKAFIKAYQWRWSWHGYKLTKEQLKMKVKFETIYIPVVRRKKYVVYDIENVKGLLNSHIIS